MPWDAQRAYYLKLGEYKRWIIKRVGDNPQHGYGDCEEISQAMAAEFPDLEVRKGFYFCMTWGRREHWWCRFKTGIESTDESSADPYQIVDPTVGQFPSGWVERSSRLTPRYFPNEAGSYDDLTDLTEEEARKIVPTGPCANCSEPCFNGDTCCSPKCHADYLAYCLNPDS